MILIRVHACDYLLDELFGLQVFAVFSLVMRISEPPPDTNHKTKTNERFECKVIIAFIFTALNLGLPRTEIRPGICFLPRCVFFFFLSLNRHVVNGDHMTE